MKETRQPPKIASPRLLEIIKRSYSELLGTLKNLSGSLRWYALVLVVVFFFNSVANAYWVVYATNVIKLSKLSWGSILMMSMVVFTLVSYPAGALFDKFDKTKILAGGLFLSTFPILFFPFCQDYWDLLFAMIIISVANGFLSSGANALMVDLCPREDRGKMIALLGQGLLMVTTNGESGSGPGMGFLLTLPSVLGLLLGGFVYDLGAGLPWLLLGGAYIICALVMFILVKVNH